MFVYKLIMFHKTSITLSCFFFFQVSGLSTKIMPIISMLDPEFPKLSGNQLQLDLVYEFYEGCRI